MPFEKRQIFVPTTMDELMQRFLYNLHRKEFLQQFDKSKPDNLNQLKRLNKDEIKENIDLAVNYIQKALLMEADERQPNS